MVNDERWKTSCRLTPLHTQFQTTFFLDQQHLLTKLLLWVFSYTDIFGDLQRPYKRCDRIIVNLNVNTVSYFPQSKLSQRHIEAVFSIHVPKNYYSQWEMFKQTWQRAIGNRQFDKNSKKPKSHRRSIQFYPRHTNNPSLTPAFTMYYTSSTIRQREFI